MAKGVQKKLGKGTRKPKVHITYTDATDGAMAKTELPFIVGVISDLSNKDIVNEEGDKIPVKNREFKEVDRDNFGEYMQALAPEAAVSVENKLDDSGGKVGGKITFRGMDDFSPDRVARQVPALKQLLELREQLSDLQSKVDGNDRLHKTLDEIIEKTTQAMGGAAGDADQGGEG